MRRALGFFIFVLLVTPVLSEPQQEKVFTPELATELDSYSHYSTDFHAAEQGASGEEFQATDYLQTVSSVAFERLLAVDYTMRIYKSLSCASDKSNAKTILRQQLFDTGFKFGDEADRIAEMLRFLKVPASSQLGLKLKDDMRATKLKLDRIRSSLD